VQFGLFNYLPIYQFKYYREAVEFLRKVRAEPSLLELCRA
jgi:hypothetical protein